MKSNDLLKSQTEFKSLKLQVQQKQQMNSQSVVGLQKGLGLANKTHKQNSSGNSLAHNDANLKTFVNTQMTNMTNQGLNKASVTKNQI